MRPVQLDMAGFASFRDPAVVDFRDADYFALVGPTGSGKSTVIDAMTFALYGSVPRWGRRNAIADALAPTSNRCTVRLVFDHNGSRYVVAREVRRSGVSITQKNVILERLPNQHGIGADGETGEVIAGDLKEVNEKIEQLLGLSFEDFCKCIVLPQGQFADFLTATPKDRQTILLKLLGAEQYETIGRAAAQRSSVAAEKINGLTAQLGDLAGATAQAELDARTAETQLTALAAVVDEQLPVIAAAADQVTAATAEHARFSTERDQLTALTVPAQVTDLQERQDRADAELAATQTAEDSAEIADQTARAELGAAPPQHLLETLLGRHREFADLTARRPASAAVAAATAEHQAALWVSVGKLDELVTSARARRDSARSAASAAHDAHQQLQGRRDQLATVVVPSGVDQLQEHTVAARAALTQARQARVTAETQDQQARAALRLAPARGLLEQTRQNLAEQTELTDQISSLSRDRKRAETALGAAARAVEQARHQAAEARERLDHARATNLAVALRPQLVVDHSCPVCDQTVRTLPPTLNATDLTEASAALALAEGTVEAAQQERGTATEHAAAVAADLAAADRRASQLAAALTGQPTEPAVIEAEMARLESLTQDVDNRNVALLEARQAEQSAEAAWDLDGRQNSAARAQLRSVQARLIPVGAPDLDDTDLAVAWATLAGWAITETGQLDTQLLPATAARLGEGEAEQHRAQAGLESAERQLRTARTEHTAATGTAARAAESQRLLTDRLGELESLLSQARTVAETEADLAHRERLDLAAQTADRRLTQARAGRIKATANQIRQRAEAAQAWRLLRETRDDLIVLGAPELEDDNLVRAWSALNRWATLQAAERVDRLAEADARIERATKDHRAAREKLFDLVTASEVELARDVTPAMVPAVVATALERARGTARRIAADRFRAASLTAAIDTVKDEQQVANLLADLLRSNKFPRWLAAAALDALVIDASAALLDLSGGQFDLTHDKGEFVVIDHADADSTRSVRTLSGGETFQASLALALALAEQMSSLATEGAAQLDSIFLDEGFGTLDPDSLETVAGTLETLANGKRMVGVVTHVAALADRAPVRFAVHRDNTTSSVVREGA